MPDDPAKSPPGKPLAIVLGVLAVVTLMVWIVVGFVGCKHAGWL